MIAPLKSAFILITLFLGKTAWSIDLNLESSLHQDNGLISANVGETVTLPCFYKTNTATLFHWYKQVLGQEPRLISTTYTYGGNDIFNDKFKDNPRFTLQTIKNETLLTISELHISDSATYWCVRVNVLKFEFAPATTISVKGADLDIAALVHQSSSESVHPGGSLSLNCTVHTGTFAGKHSVYWFRKSEDPQTGIIYIHGSQNDQRERKPDTETHACVYNLPIQSVDCSHCAVVSCGNILFEQKILDFKDEVDLSEPLVYFLSGALVFTTILTVFLALSIYKMNSRSSCQCTEFQAPSTTNAEGNQNADNLHYAALRKPHVKGSRRQSVATSTQCVYSSVKQ